MHAFEVLSVDADRAQEPGNGSRQSGRSLENSGRELKAEKGGTVREQVGEFRISVYPGFRHTAMMKPSVRGSAQRRVVVRHKGVMFPHFTIWRLACQQTAAE